MCFKDFSLWTSLTAATAQQFEHTIQRYIDDNKRYIAVNSHSDDYKPAVFLTGKVAIPNILPFDFAQMSSSSSLSS